MPDFADGPSWSGKDGYERALDIRAAIQREGGSKIFTTVFSPRRPLEGELSGCVVSVKALFDVAGEVTHAGSARLLRNRPAVADADVVTQFRSGGAMLIGHTNMSELAYSGLGLNPHFGTPETPLFPGATAGGSSSGAAASVARRWADIGLASDTGGSARIPAAFCGLVGWKPTASRLSRHGTVPLSFSLDGVGLIARDVRDVASAFFALSPPRPFDAARPRLLIPEGFGVDSLDTAVATAFAEALHRIETSGWRLEHLCRRHTDAYLRLPVWHFAAVESRALHPDAWAESSLLDPNVARRMKRADEVSAVDYAASVAARNSLIASFRTILAHDIVVLPTVAILPPDIRRCADPAQFDSLNLLALRNTSFANVIDGCSITLPIGGHPGVGLLLTAAHGLDEHLLAAASYIEGILQRT